MLYAFDISERFDTPVMLRSTTRISHSNSLVEIRRERMKPKQAAFRHDVQKYVMLPVYARMRRPLLEERLAKLATFAETFPYNKIVKGGTKLGIVSSSVAYQYAREIFPEASFLKLGMTYPLPQALIRKFAGSVDKVLVVEELDPFLEEHIRVLGIKVIGKEFIPRFGELDLHVMEDAGRRAGLLFAASKSQPVELPQGLPGRPPLLCPGCPHTGMFFVLSNLGQRARLLDDSGKAKGESKMIITGDIGCYTLGAYPPLRAMDTTACMGASIGKALGMEKAGVAQKVVAVIGDSTFMHSGITGVVDAVYNQSQITIVILDNSSTAMTGHQHHPGTGVSVQGEVTMPVDIEKLVKGIGVSDVKVVDAFDIKALRAAMRSSLDTPDLSVVIVRGTCAVLQKKRTRPRTIDVALCDNCGTCIKIGCTAIQKLDDQVSIDAMLCVGDACTVCQQLCPKKAIGPVSTASGESK
jgi:indolepyruvate ferredoxin oxidoreductase alpha subunit